MAPDTEIIRDRIHRIRRYVVVHAYADADIALVYEILSTRMKDFSRYIVAIESYLGEPS